MLKKCGSCALTVERAKLDGGGLECHGRPPVPMLLPVQGPLGQHGAALTAIFPSVLPDAIGCAKHEEKPAGLKIVN